MALLTYKCPKCSAQIKTDESLVGEEMKCAFCGEKSKIPIPGVYVGMNLGGFIVEKQLGVGGMGEVWLARQEKLDRHVALKILSPKYTSNPAFVERFMSEVRNTAKLEHPNIVTAFHAGVENGIYYMAISYICGETVFDRISDGKPMSEKESLEIIRAIAGALGYAWSEYRILHRDIKPSNIMIDKKSVPKLMDMGISKSLNEDSSLTMAGMMIGTPYYVSPEQAVGAKDIDFRADIYSLGATLYHMVTGNVPYDASTAMAIVSKHISEPLPDPRIYNSTLSEQIVALIKIMMAKDKNNRQTSWQGVIDDVDRVLKGEFPITPLPGADKTEIASSFIPDNNVSCESASVNSEFEKKGLGFVSTGNLSSVQFSDTDSEKMSENNKQKKTNVFLLFLLISIIVVLVLVTLTAGYFAYRYFAKQNEKRTSPLPTEVIVKPKRSTIAENSGVRSETNEIGKEKSNFSTKSTDKPDAQDAILKEQPPQEEKNVEQREKISKKVFEMPLIPSESKEEKDTERKRPDW